MIATASMWFAYRGMARNVDDNGELKVPVLAVVMTAIVDMTAYAALVGVFGL